MKTPIERGSRSASSGPLFVIIGYDQSAARHGKTEGSSRRRSVHALSIIELSPVPARRPLFGKGEGTLARVFGSLQRAVQFVFELQSLGKRQIEAAQRSLLDPLYRQRRALADLSGDLLTFAHQLVDRYDMIDEPQS